MRQVAPHVYLLPTWYGLSINAYLVGDVLIDAGIRPAGPRLLAQLQGRPVHAHALTHAHSDHQGASRFLCETLHLPLWASAPEARVMEREFLPRTSLSRLQAHFWRGPPYPVARELRAGDEVGGFVVLELPGHSAGHLGFWRARDRVLLAGDVLVNLDMRTGRTRLGEPPRAFTQDRRLNRDSIRRVAELQPALTLFGHGPPLSGPGQIEALVRRF